MTKKLSSCNFSIFCFLTEFWQLRKTILATLWIWIFPLLLAVMLQQPSLVWSLLGQSFYRVQQNSQYCIKNFVLISNKVTWIVTWEILERFVVHVSLRVYALYCMQCPFIKAEMEKLLKIVETVDKNSPLKRRGK